jgi:alpha-tubulin suppressor-like RCC1 family protein
MGRNLRFHIHRRSGFALPTVLIASVVMMIVLASVLTSLASGIVVLLDNAHYTQYAKAASQSGLNMAQACLKDSNYTPQWSNSAPLKPNTNCSGVVQAGVSQYIHDSNGVRSSFSIGLPATLANGVQRVTVAATTERLRTSDSTAWRTYSASSYATISGQSSFSSVTFGYSLNKGAFFGVVEPNGRANAVGYNDDGQLGNGTTNNALSPTTYALPDGVAVSKLYTSFLSVGSTMFAITTDGQLYGSGLNSTGQLGNGTTATAQSTPVKFQLPAGVQAVYVSTGDTFTVVIGSDNNVYSAGFCGDGILGYTYTISGCSSQSTYKRVALPAVNVGDLNTLPVTNTSWLQSTNIAIDRRNAFIIMQGGRAYGWGDNIYGQLGNGTVNDSSTPVQVGTLGNSGQPKAIQVAFDGDTTWILDDAGDVWSAGLNFYGETGTSTPVSSSTSLCIDNPSNSTATGQRVRISTCSNGTSQMLHFDSDGTLKFHPNSSTTLCIENNGGVSTNGNQIRTATCSGSTAQQWAMKNDKSIVNPATAKCLDNPSNSSTNNTNLQLYTCNSGSSQKWTIGNVPTLAKVWKPTGHGKVVRISTDQATTLYLMEDGTVWASGRNDMGQMGAGSAAVLTYGPQLRQVVLPSGRTAVNFYTAAYGGLYANSYVVLNDGSVWGAGSNNWGQLGNGTTTPYESSLVKMTLPSGVVAQSVQTGLGTTVVLTTDGKIYTVGNNSNGQLGDGTTNNSSTPLARKYVNSRPFVLY